MSKLEDNNIDYIQIYYINCMKEIEAGCRIDILYEALEYHEECEMYLACAGIKKALDWYENQHELARALAREIINNTQR